MLADGLQGLQCSEQNIIAFMLLPPHPQSSSMNTQQQHTNDPAAQPEGASPPSNGVSNLCIRLSLKGKEGTKNIRLSYNAVLGSYESLINTILDRYLSSDANPFIVSDYVVQLRDVGDDTGWPMAIENTEDVDLAINSPLALSNGHIKMAAMIRLKTDPPIDFGSVEVGSSKTASKSVDTVVGGTISITNRKRKVETASPAAAAAVTPTKKPPAKKRKSKKGATTVGDSNAKLPLRARIIGSIAEIHTLGMSNPPRKQVALFAGYTCAGTKSFSNAISAMKTEGVVEYPDGKTIALTQAGLQTAEAKAISPPQNNLEVHVRIKALLQPKQQQIFDVLTSEGGGALPRDEVRAAVGYTCDSTKSWKNSLSKMSTLGIVHYDAKDPHDPKRKYLQLTDMCYPFPNQHSNFGTAEEIESAALRAFTPPLGDSFGLTAVSDQADQSVSL